MKLNNYMILKNYVSTHYADTSSTTPDIGLKNMSGASIPFCTGIYNSGTTFTALNYGLRCNISALVGSDDTEPVSTDYCLGNNITQSFSNYGVTVSESYTDDKLSTIITITGVNNTNSSLTIAEFGVTKIIYTRWGEYSNDTAMLIREVLDSPIVVPSGKGFQIIYEWAEE